MSRFGLSRMGTNRRGLVVLAATTWLYVMVYAPLTVYAILFVALEDEFQASTTATGEIGSLAWAVFNMSTPLPTYLIHKWGPRITSAVGILLCGGGLFISTFSTHIWMLFLFYGFVQGLGLCFIQLVSTQLLTSYFRGSGLVRAISFAAFGETVGMFAASPIFALGVSKLGWRLVCQITSVIILVGCLPTCYVLDSTTHAQLPQEDNDVTKTYNKEEEAKSDFIKKGEIRAIGRKTLAQIMGIPGIWIFSIATILYVLCLGYVMISLVEILVAQGQSVTDSAWFVTIFAISQVVGKILNIIIGNHLPISNMKLMILMCITGGMMSLGMVYWEGLQTYVLAFSIVNGLVRSTISSRNLPAAIDVFGQEASPVVINFLYISIGIAYLSSSLVGGLSYDLTGSYRSAHISIFIIWLLAALLLVPLAFRWPSCIFESFKGCGKDYTKVHSLEQQRHYHGKDRKHIIIEDNNSTTSASDENSVSSFIEDKLHRTSTGSSLVPSFKETAC